MPNVDVKESTKTKLNLAKSIFLANNPTSKGTFDDIIDDMADYYITNKGDK